MNKEENLIVYHIPTNYKNGISLFGFSFSTKGFFEGVIIALVGALVGGLLFYGLLSGLSSTIKLSGLLILILGGFILGNTGINDEPVSKFISHYKGFKKTKRATYYNPRVKLEIKKFSEDELTGNSANMIKTKIISALNKQENISSLDLDDDVDFKDDKQIIKQEKEKGGKSNFEKLKEKTRKSKGKKQKVVGRINAK